MMERLKFLSSNSKFKGFHLQYQMHMGFPGGSEVKNLPAKQKMQV